MNFLFRLTTSYSNCKILASEEQMKARVKNFGIRNLKKFAIRNPTLGIRNPRCGFQNSRLARIPSHGAMQLLNQKLKGLLKSLFMNISRNVPTSRRTTGLPSSVCVADLCSLYINGSFGCVQRIL